MPTKFSGLTAASDSLVMGSVEVFEPQKPSSDRYCSVLAIILFFSSTFSKTASIIRSQPLKSSSWAVGVISFNKASACD